MLFLCLSVNTHILYKYILIKLELIRHYKRAIKELLIYAIVIIMLTYLCVCVCVYVCVSRTFCAVALPLPLPFPFLLRVRVLVLTGVIVHLPHFGGGER